MGARLTETSVGHDVIKATPRLAVLRNARQDMSGAHHFVAGMEPGSADAVRGGGERGRALWYSPTGRAAQAS